MTPEWYVLRSKPHKERQLFDQVQARHLECFFPRITVKPVNPRSAKERAFFPGYMFVRVKLDEIGTNTFNWMPYSLGLVAFEGVPATVPDQIIDQIKSLLQTIVDKNKSPITGFSPGEKIEVLSGPFKGYEGIFDTSLQGADRVRILLKLLSDRHVSVEIDVDQIISKDDED